MASMENVVVVGFADDSKAYQALSVLKRCDAEGRITLRGAAVVERGADGIVRVPDGQDNQTAAGLSTGSLVGMLVGVLGGPLGMLLGWGAGALVGGTVDVRRAKTTDVALGALSQRIPPGETVVVAELTEPAVEVVDVEMANLGGAVTRRPVDEVVAEANALEDAAEAAEAEARKALKQQRKEARKQHK